MSLTLEGMQRFGLSSGVALATPRRVCFGTSLTPSDEAPSSPLPKASPLPVLKRLAAFLSPSNLSAGVSAARQAFAKSPQLETIGLLCDAAFLFFSGGLYLIPAILMPHWAFSKTLEAFFEGVQDSAAGKLQAPQ